MSNKKIFAAVRNRLATRYDIDFWQERGFAHIMVSDNFNQDALVWVINSDKTFDEATQEYFDGGVYSLIEDGFITWDDKESVLEYLYELGVIAVGEFNYDDLDEFDDDIPWEDEEDFEEELEEEDDV